jgi:vacuolar protein sorting-associated protein 8
MKCLLFIFRDIVFTRLWENVFLDPVSKVIYLESLEPLILNDQLTFIPPAILQQFVNCYEQSGKLQALEACIIHLDISSLDLHQVVQICWSHGLYDAIIYIHNKALNDYTTPIHELVPIIDQAVSSGMYHPKTIFLKWIFA